MEIAALISLAITFGMVPISTLHFRRLFLKEDKFHVVVREGRPQLVLGPRRKPIAVADAEIQVAAARQLAGYSGWIWAVSLWKIYGPRAGSNAGDQGELETMRRRAIESQRRALITEATSRGLDGSMGALIMDASTDAGFELLRSKLSQAPRPEFGETPKPLALTDAERAIIVPLEDGPEEIVILEDRRGGKKAKKLKELTSARPPRMLPTGAVDADGLVQQPNGIPLYPGFTWGFSFTDQGESYERMIVKVLDPAGHKIHQDGFYTSVYKTPETQAAEIKKIQTAMRTSLAHKLDPVGLSPELRKHF